MKIRGAWMFGLLLVAGCSSTPLDSTESVCDEFAQFIQDGRPADQRPAVVRSMGEVIGNAAQPVQDGHRGLADTVSNPSAQPLADDTFAAACFDAGWES